MAARTACRAGATGPTGPAGPDQPRGPAGPAAATGRARPAGPAGTEQPAAGPTVGPGPGRPVSAVADQWPPRQRQGVSIRRVQKVLLDGLQVRDLQKRCARGLGGGVGARAAAQRLHKLLLKRDRLGAQRLIRLPIVAEQPRDRGRHLIAGRRRNSGGRRRPGRRGLFDRLPDSAQIRRGRGQGLRCCDQESRHLRLPSSSTGRLGPLTLLSRPRNVKLFWARHKHYFRSVNWLRSV